MAVAGNADTVEEIDDNKQKNPTNITRRREDDGEEEATILGLLSLLVLMVVGN